MSKVKLNKFEKYEKVIELYKEGKTIREISKIVHLSFRDISKRIKEYERKIRLETKREKYRNDDNSQLKSISKSSRAFELLLQGKKPVEVAIELNLSYEEIRKYWTEFLRLQHMKDLYHLYVDNEYHLDDLFRVYYFLLRNKVDKKILKMFFRLPIILVNYIRCIRI